MYSSVKEHQVCVNTAPSICHMISRDPYSVFASSWLDSEGVNEEVSSWWYGFHEDKQKDQTNSKLKTLCHWSQIFLNPRNDILACAMWQHDPWFIRGECGWGVLGHVLNVWLHFLILSPFHSFISSFDWQTVVMLLHSLSFLCKNGVSAASVSTDCSWPVVYVWRICLLVWTAGV